jgi:L-ribulokinase
MQRGGFQPRRFFYVSIRARTQYNPQMQPQTQSQTQLQSQYSIGLDYGTSSVRGLLVRLGDGMEVATCVFAYPHGTDGVVLDARDPHLARQHPQDYLDGAECVIRGVLAEARTSVPQFDPAEVVGLGIDTTGSTPIPVTADGTPLALTPEFADHPAAMAYLWKDHTGHAEAVQITEVAAQMRPEYLAKCGGAYSSEWFWSKILRCLRADPAVFHAAHTWVEHADWMPAVLTGNAMTGNTAPQTLKRGICAAGHKAFFHPEWNGWPDEDFLAALDSRLIPLRDTLPAETFPVGVAAGTLSADWAQRTGLPVGLPVSVGAFDAHLGGVGAGIAPGTLVKNVGTSTCDMMVAPLSDAMPDIPGLCGIVPESILPGSWGLEAGQSAVGDIFNWSVAALTPEGLGHRELTDGAAQIAAGASGLLALDWHNGNRTILVDPRLTGLVLGLTLHTTPAELYRAWIEATAFGARVIVERLEEYGQHVARVTVCGGISLKNPLVMQIYADVLGRPLSVSRSAQTAALGSAIAGAVAAGAYASFADATAAMTGLDPRTFTPDPKAVAVYDRLYALYHQLHDAFGVSGTSSDLSGVMKQLLDIKDAQRQDAP